MTNNHLFSLLPVCFLSRTQSGITCPCIAVLSEYRMRGLERARGGWSILKGGGEVKHQGDVQSPWTMVANTPRLHVGVQPRKRQRCKQPRRVRWRTYLLVVCPSGQEVPLPGAAMNWNPVGLIFAHELTPTLAPWVDTCHLSWPIQSLMMFQMAHPCLQWSTPAPAVFLLPRHPPQTPKRALLNFQG